MKSMLKKSLLCLLVVIIALSSSCQSAIQTSAKTTEIATATQSTILDSTSTSKYPIPTQSSACPIVTRQGSIEIPPQDTDVSSLVLGYLNEGGDPLALQSIFSDRLDEQYRYFLVVVSDLDLDGLPEVFLAGALHAPIDHAPGHISIFHCKDGQYQLVASFEIGDTVIPELITIESRTPHSFPIIIIQRLGIGWVKTYLAYGWDGVQWEEFLSHDSLNGEIVIEESPSGIAEFTFYEYTTGSLSCGPQRTLIEHYAWHADQLISTSIRYSPSAYRIHVLEDAQVALDEGRVGEAIALYESAAPAPYLLDYPSEYERSQGVEDLAGAYQEAFAHFRAALLWLSLSNRNKASEHYGFPHQYLEGEPGSEFIRAAEQVSVLVENGQDVKEACLSVVSSLREEYPSLSGSDGHVGYWGWCNISYDFDSLCPFE
jgi:hypothetical protein